MHDIVIVDTNFEMKVNLTIMMFGRDDAKINDDVR